MRQVRRARSKGARWLWGVLGSLLLLLAGVYLSIPYLVQHLLPQWLAEQGVTVRMDEVRHDILEAKLVLSDVTAHRDGPVLSAGEVVFSLDLGALFSGALRVDHLSFHRGELTVLRDGHEWRIGGLALDRVTAHWVEHVGRLETTDFAVQTNVTGLERLRIDQAHVQRGSVAAGGPVIFGLEGELGRGQVLVTGEAWPASAQTEVVGELTLRDVAVERVRPGFLDPDLLVERAVVEGQVRLDVLIDSKEQRIQADVDGRLQLQDLQASTAEKPYVAQGLESRGVSSIIVSQGELSAINFRGQLALTRWQTRVGGAEQAGRPVLLEDVRWEGRLEWSPAAKLSQGLKLVGDAALGRLMLGLDEAQMLRLEGVSLWGLEQEPGKALRVGHIEAGGVVGGVRTGGPEIGSMGLGAPSWRAAALASGSLEVDDGLVLRQGFLELKKIELLSGPFQRDGRLRQARLEGLLYEEGRLRAASLALHDLSLSRVPTGESGPALSLVQALLLDLSLDPSAEYLSVGEARLGGLSATVARDVGLGWRLPAFGPLERDPGDMRVALGTLRIEGNSRLSVEDRSVSPPYRLVLDNLSARLAGWDSHRLTDSGRFMLEGVPGGTGRLGFSGRLGPLVGPLRVALHGEASGVRLTELPPKLRRTLLGRTEDGAMSAWLDFRAENERWTAYADLRFVAIEPGAAGPSWLDNGLRFLNDERGGLRLELELQAEPFKDTGEEILERATQAAILAGIVDHYGSLGVNGEAARAALREGRLPIESVFFQPGSASFGRVAASYLEAVANRMQHRPFTRVRICAHAMLVDLRHESPERQAEMGPLPPDEVEKTLAIAELRDRFVRNELVSRLGLSEERLLPCEPAYDADDAAQPRVDLILELAP